ncbi:serine/threonine transporter [Acerihabitans arboris]|uniref:HAAAP family serine/threonine permease n=1 Tax=Acerihabitans arboris TaxID=2691583 RepID=A0A845SNU2_9GAMM|nr:serine/threonine transporter [Acerihabitans arboris]NDL62875.1 HAAAP family serine/threonine permease [Acerihabitans arboris]
MNTTQATPETLVERATSSSWRKSDAVWMMGLYGTAIGAGVLFLPINAGIGGLVPLLIMALIAFPMTFFAHRALCRLVLSGNSACRDITDVVEQHFGPRMGQVITLLYFFAIYPILLVYGVAITNTVDSFITHQLHLTAPPRALLALILILGLMTVIRLGKEIIVKVMSVLVFPFVAVLLFLGAFLMPHWSADIFTRAMPFSGAGQGGLLSTLWLAVPVLVFSFNHSPIISAFAMSKKAEYGDRAEQKCSRILVCSNILMVLTVMFFVFSCVLSLSPEDLAAAKAQNISILSFLANHFNNPFIGLLAPIVAFVAITKSFLGHYLGASEGLISLMGKALRKRGKPVHDVTLDRLSGLFMLVSTWLVATVNPSILGIIEMLGGPIIAMLLFLLPMYAIHKVPAMARYRGAASNYFVWAVGFIALSAIVYKLL